MKPATTLLLLRYRLVWLILLTVSVVGMTNYLFESFLQGTISGWTLLVLFCVAWGTVYVTWRRHPLRRRTSGVTLACLMGEIIFLTAIYVVFFHSHGPERLTIRPAPPQSIAYTKWRYALLETAIEKNDLAQVQSILARYGYPNSAFLATRNINDESPLDTAVCAGNLQIVSVLLDNGAPMDEFQGFTTFAFAASRGNFPMQKLLLHHGATTNGSDAKQRPLWGAISCNEIKEVAFLLQHGADPNTHFTVALTPGPKIEDNTVLQCAQANGDTAIIRLLKQAGATH